MISLDGLAYLTAVLLAAVFTGAAVAKWRDPAGTARGFRALGVPRPWPAARAVPAVEAVVAAGLVVIPAWAAPVALALLSAFTVFLTGRLRAGVIAPCQCFGGRGTAPLSAADLVRNAWLMTAAAVASTADGPVVPTAGAVTGVAVVTAVAWSSVAAIRRRRSSAAG